MTIYGESESGFRPRPAAATLLVVSFCALTAGAQLASLFLSVAESGRFHLRGAESWYLYAPLANDPFLHPFVAGAEERGAFERIPTPLIAAAAAIVVSLLVHWFAPVERTAAPRFVIDSANVGFVMFAVIAPAAAAILAPAENRLKLIALGAALAGALVIILIERRLIEMMGSFFVTETPSSRVRRWLLRLPAGLFALAGLSVMNHFEGGLVAVGVTLAATLLENLWRVPKESFAGFVRPEMREAAATMPIIAALLALGSVWLFGSRAAGRPATAVVVVSGTAELEKVSSLAWKQLPLPGKQPPPEQKIEIRWSKDRKK